MVKERTYNEAEKQTGGLILNSYGATGPTHDDWT